MNPALLALLGARVAAGGGGTLTATYLHGAYSLDNLTSYTFTSVPVGAADASRSVVVAVEGITPGSVTVGGVAATLDTYINAGGAQVSMWRAALPTGSDPVSVVVGSSAAAYRCVIGVWTITGAANITATAATDGTEPLSVDATIPAGGVTLAVSGCNGAAAGTACTWTGATERYDVGLGSGESHISASVADTTTPGTIAATWAFSQGACLAAVTYSAA